MQGKKRRRRRNRSRGRQRPDKVAYLDVPVHDTSVMQVADGTPAGPEHPVGCTLLREGVVPLLEVAIEIPPFCKLLDHDDRVILLCKCGETEVQGSEAPESQCTKVLVLHLDVCSCSSAHQEHSMHLNDGWVV